MIFARKMPEFYVIIARKNIFPEFFGARAHLFPRLLRPWRWERNLTGPFPKKTAPPPPEFLHGRGL